jgi:hypothetical protein
MPLAEAKVQSLARAAAADSGVRVPARVAAARVKHGSARQPSTQ